MSMKRKRKTIHYCKLSMLYKCLFHNILVSSVLPTKVQIGSQYFRNNFPVINVILCKIDMQLESLLKSSHRRTLWRRQRLLKQQQGGRRGEMMKTSKVCINFEKSIYLFQYIFY